ncbi:MAG: NUDIX domain-containing protein, partial [Candidatus Pacearchaeota archaeon]
MKKRKKLNDKQWNTIYSKVPRLCIDLIIIKDKKVLLTKRSISPFKGLWHFPGGGVQHRETI